MSLPLVGDWPDWNGQTAVVVASGPSTKDAPLSEIKGHARVLVVKESWELAPWADALYASDGLWWESQKGVPSFRGMKFSASPRAVRLYPDIKPVRLRAAAKILVDVRGTIGCGSRSGNGHSGFHALNLAVQFGSKRIVLAGFDLTLDQGSHWHGRPRVAAPTSAMMAEWRAALDGCAAQLVELGIEVINASAESALTNYPKASLLEAVAGPMQDGQDSNPRRAYQSGYRTVAE